MTHLALAKSINPLPLQCVSQSFIILYIYFIWVVIISLICCTKCSVWFDGLVGEIQPQLLKIATAAYLVFKTYTDFSNIISNNFRSENQKTNLRDLAPRVRKGESLV
jgi:glucan phosphoethanolaminetransferase (alkaline phosphatase superfamily)